MLETRAPLGCGSKMTKVLCIVVSRPKFMANAKCIAKQLAQRCPGTHRHIQLISGRAKAAEVYPDKLCAAIVCGLMEQMQEDSRIARYGSDMGTVTASEESWIDWREYYDDLSGGKLNSDLVRQARAE